MEEINKTGKNSFSVCFCIFACSAGSPPPQLPKTTRNSQSFPSKIFNPLMTNNRRHFQRRISSSPQPRLVPIPDSNTFTFIRGFGTFFFQKSSRKQSRRRKSVRGNTPAELLERKPETAILWFGISDTNLSLFRYQEPEKKQMQKETLPLFIRDVLHQSRETLRRNQTIPCTDQSSFLHSKQIKQNALG